MVYLSLKEIMKQLRILEANELGHGILVEMDAGYVSPRDEFNANILKESKNLDYKNPFEFYSYMIVNLHRKFNVTIKNHSRSRINHDECRDKICKVLASRRPSKLRFLSIEYVHPDMDHYVPIEIPENMMYVGNEILSSTFIYRHLHYTCRDFVFDERYKIIIMKIGRVHV